jgi:hypothetical protein
VDEGRRRRLIDEAARLQSETDAIVRALDEYLAGLDPAGRQREVNAVWLEPPITQAEALNAYPPLSDQFDVLQGDIVRTDAAFVLGQRIPGAYVVASATCDAVIRPRPRRGSILLLPIVPRTIDGFDGLSPAAKENAAERRLEQLLGFRTTGALYLPPLIDDSDDVLFNEIRFEHIAALESVQIPTVQRLHSMSLIGWRAFAGLLRLVITRTGDEEVGFRLAVAVRRAA